SGFERRRQKLSRRWAAQSQPGVGRGPDRDGVGRAGRRRLVGQKLSTAAARRSRFWRRSSARPKDQVAAHALFKQPAIERILSTADAAIADIVWNRAGGNHRSTAVCAFIGRRPLHNGWTVSGTGSRPAYANAISGSSLFRDDSDPASARAILQ